MRLRPGACALGIAWAVIAAPAFALNDGDLDPKFGGAGTGQMHAACGGFGFGTNSLRRGPNDGLTVAGGDLVTQATQNFDFASALLSADGGALGCQTFPFDLGGTNGDLGYAVAEQVDGRRVLVGFVDGTVADPEARVGLLGLQSTNALDLGFDGDGKRTINFAGRAGAEDAATRSSGDIFFAGFYDHEPGAAGTGWDCLIGKLQANGASDDTFDGDGLQFVGWDRGGTNVDVCLAIALRHDGHLVVGGYSDDATGSSDFAMAVVDSTGQLEPNFSGNGKLIIAWGLASGFHQDQIASIAVDAQGNAVAVGQVATSAGVEVGVVRVKPNGTFDTTFSGDGKLHFSIAPGAGDIESVDSVRILPPPSNDIVIAGSYYPAAGAAVDGFVVLLHPDGTFDDGFAGNGKQGVDVANTSGRTFLGALEIQGGEILVAGGFASGDPLGDHYWVARLWRHDVFGDDFESGDFRLWSNYADP